MISSRAFAESVMEAASTTPDPQVAPPAPAFDPSIFAAAIITVAAAANLGGRGGGGVGNNNRNRNIGRNINQLTEIPTGFGYC